MPDYKLDRSNFNGRNAGTVSGDATYYLKLTWQERLKISLYLNSKAFNYDLNNPPKMNKSAFKVRSRN